MKYGDPIESEEEYRLALKFLSQVKAKISSLTWIKQKTELVIKEWRNKNTSKIELTTTETKE